MGPLECLLLPLMLVFGIKFSADMFCSVGMPSTFFVNAADDILLAWCDTWLMSTMQIGSMDLVLI